MGMERWYIAIVDGCRLIERANEEPQFGEYLGCPEYFRPSRAGYLNGEEDADFLAEVERMNRIHPGIDTRIYTLDRYFDILHFLLSEGRRRGRYDATDWGTKAILGSTSLPEHVRGLQGHKSRYIPPDDVKEIDVRFGELSSEDIIAVYSPIEMERQCVYKYWADRADTETCDLTLKYIEGLRAFYAAVSSNDEGVLCVVT